MDSVATNILDDHPTGEATASHMESLFHQDNDAILQTSDSCLDSSESKQDDRFPQVDSATPVPGRKRKLHPSRGDHIDGNPLGEPSSKESPSGYIHICHNDSERAKKRKLDHDRTASDRSLLPMEIWHYIFSFLDPKTLGALLRVNKSFHLFLASKQPTPAENSSSTHGILKPLSANSIWSSARKSYHSGMPRPLANMTELDMWRLIGATTCQACGKNGLTNQLPSTNLTPWERGPGTNGICIFWPFGIRTCSKCLLEHTKKDVDLVLSSFPSFLLPGLSFVLLTSSMHMVSSVALRSADIPTDLHLSKYYSNLEIDQLMNEFHHVKSLGSAALEEWMKGLESMGKRKLSDASRWEQWENSGGLYETRLGYYGRTTDNSPHSRGMPRSERSSFSPTGSANRTTFSGYIRDAHSRRSGSSSPYLPTNFSTKNQQTRGERSLREVDEAKDSRRAEIERRCLALHPPLTAAVLSHMDSFSAAIQIPHELTDKDWEYLKPRLLAQREMAESKEIERLKESQLLQAKTEERRQQEARSKQDKQALDDQWEDAQRLIRDQINLYADEIIKKNWNKGTNLTKDQCAQFAAEVLMHVRARFYAHVEEEDAIARASGVAVKSDSIDAPPTRKLILENMKWVFDNKIKLLTQQLVKELFLCNGCENNSRYYGFEGVVQHYAAKHTTALSSGNVIVFWRAEWPEKPPFHPNPNAAKALLHASSQGGFGQPHSFPRQQGASGIYIGTPEQRHTILTDSNPSSRATYGRSPFRSPYTSAYMHGPFQPPSPRTSPYYPGYMFPPPSPAMESAPIDPSSAYSSPYHAHVVPVNHQHHVTQAPHPYPSPAYGTSSPSNQGLLYKLPQSGHSNVLGPSRNAANPDNYQFQLDNMARVAREVWNATSGIKDFANSIRAHVLIHHVATTMQLLFHFDASIALFLDGLNNRAQMKPLRGLNGLDCKHCIDGGNIEPGSHLGNSKSYAFPALLSHFQSMHMQHARHGVDMEPQEEKSGPDWKIDMIALPDLSTLKLLQHNPGMDDFKLRIISQALPGVFQSSLPKLPPETFMTKRSPAVHHAYMADQRLNHHSPNIHHAQRVEYSSVPGPREFPPDTVPIDTISGRNYLSRDPISRHDSPSAPPLYDESRSYDRGAHYPARSPRRLIVRARSPRYIRLHHEYDYREDDADDLSSGHHDRYYIPVSTRPTMSDRSKYGCRSILPEQYEGDIPLQQQRVERQPHPTRPSEGQETSEGSILPNHPTSVIPSHEDSHPNAGEITAADQFLNTLVPGQETSSELSRNDSSSSTSKYTGSRRRIPAGDDTTVAYYSQDNAWSQRWDDHPGSVRTHESVPREGRYRARSPEVIQLRSYGRKPSSGTASSITMESSKVPPHSGTSRFDRYEALRQESLRGSSKSPSIVKEDISRDAPLLYYDDQDPRSQQSRLPPQQQQQNIGDRERDLPGRGYVRMERENSRRNYRTGGIVRDPAYYDDAMEY
ncbi:conserved hypothetical protein [Talaromyces marneffei ATCC 18224]|uniref:F-box domain-containing protein n=1 Tax=Talaromyces marneffei (strain ATCC 18224 / CBS 334.59 / QM 7333) TaxID=441960 RepID=B6QMJ2_TALMQ|nr:conserved hypothetical protein [Talaromyces marneffei ATCC 18224]